MKSYDSEYERRRINLVSKYIPFGDYESLDVGCGIGVFSKIMHDKGHSVLGIDYDIEAINVARRNYNNFRGMKFAVTDVMDFINHATKKYDFILALEIIEHLEQSELFLKNITSLLRINGKLIISTPNFFQ